MADCPVPSHHQAQPARRMALRFMAASGVAAAVSLTTGCALTPWAASAPTVYLMSVERLPGEPLERRFDLQLRIQNPNPKPIAFNGMALTLELNNRTVGTGVTNASGLVPAHGDTLLKVPVNVSAPFETLQMLGLTDKLPRGDLPYTLKGRLTGGTLERVLGTEATFESSGSVRWPR